MERAKVEYGSWKLWIPSNYFSMLYPANDTGGYWLPCWTFTMGGL